GEDEMREWWREKDFSNVLNEVSITYEKDMESIVADIYKTILNG
ncbi:MAG: uridine kinase, partial [Lachnospiraceae bacterium]|nr:uridine kinase [Lachnospiraceae bacterium]